MRIYGVPNWLYHRRFRTSVARFIHRSTANFGPFLGTSVVRPRRNLWLWGRPGERFPTSPVNSQLSFAGLISRCFRAIGPHEYAVAFTRFSNEAGNQKDGSSRRGEKLTVFIQIHSKNSSALIVFVKKYKFSLLFNF